MEASFSPLFLTLTIVLHLALGIFVLQKSPRLLLNRLVFGFTLIASLWSFTVLMISITSEYQELLFWVRSAHAAAAITPWFVLALVYTFLGSSGSALYKNKTITILFFFGSLLVVLCFTPFMIEEIIVYRGIIDYVYGPLFILYPVFFSGVTVYSLFKLFWHLRYARGLIRHQIRFFIGGILLSFVLGSLSNLFLPLLGFTAVSLREFGPVFTVIMVVSITYAILKYRLMDIRLALGKFLEYAFAVLALVGIYILFIFSLGQYVGIHFGSKPFYLILLFIIFAVVFFPYLKGKVQLLVNRYYYQGVYNYHDTLLEASKAMTSILQMDKLLNYLVNKVVNAMHIEGAIFFVRGPDGTFTAAAQKYQEQYNPEYSINFLYPSSPLLSYLEKNGDVLLQTDLVKMQPQAEKEVLENEMNKLSAQAAVPIIIENKLEGAFFLGFKISGEPYFRDDVNLLSTLSYQLAVALQNSRLYDEVLEIKQYLENIMENMGNGLIAVNTKKEIMIYNCAAEKLTGNSAQEVLGKKAVEVLGPELNDVLKQSVEKQRGISGLEIEITLDGKTHFLTCNTAPVELSNTGEKGTIIILNDITRIKELEREKSQAERLASLGEMAAGIAHEIKNPLVSIKTYAELLPQRYSNGEFRNSFSKVVTQEIERINRLIMELLNFSKIPRSSFNEENLSALMDEVLALLSPQLDSQEIKLYKSFSKDILPILADKDQLKQAFFNICLNGIQSMQEGGSLKIELSSNKDEMPDNGTDASVSPKVKVTIKDSGPGVPSEEKEKIFNPFYTTKVDGIGIGLSISHKIITEHGGTIQFFTSYQGTEFEIILPALLKNGSSISKLKSIENK